MNYKDDSKVVTKSLKNIYESIKIVKSHFKCKIYINFQFKILSKSSCWILNSIPENCFLVLTNITLSYLDSIQLSIQMEFCPFLYPNNFQRVKQRQDKAAILISKITAAFLEKRKAYTGIGYIPFQHISAKSLSFSPMDCCALG